MCCAQAIWRTQHTYYHYIPASGHFKVGGDGQGLIRSLSVLSEKRSGWDGALWKTEAVVADSKVKLAFCQPYQDPKAPQFPICAVSRIS